MLVKESQSFFCSCFWLADLCMASCSYCCRCLGPACHGLFAICEEVLSPVLADSPRFCSACHDWLQAEPRVFNVFSLTNLLWTNKKERIKDQREGSVLPEVIWASWAWKNCSLTQSIGLKSLTYTSSLKHKKQCNHFFFSFFFLREEKVERGFLMQIQQFHISLSHRGKLLCDVKWDSHYSSQYLCCLQSITSREAQGNRINFYSESGWQRYEHLIKISFISWK